MSDYDRIAKVIQFIEQNQSNQPRLQEIADHVGLSPAHFQRLFSRWAGVTPKDFLQCLTLKHAKAALQAGENVLDASLSAGLSGPSRLHDLCVRLEAASPGELKSGGDGWTIKAGFADSPFGHCLIGESPRGICHLSFVERRDRMQAQAAILQQWPNANLNWDAAAAATVDRIFRIEARDSVPLRLLVRGTEFQVKVWRALLRIPFGSVTS